MNNYESEFCGVALAAYRAATNLSKEGRLRLSMAFDFYGLNASEPARSREADADGSTLLSRIIETVSNRIASGELTTDVDVAGSLKVVVDRFIDHGFDFNAQGGLRGAKALWELLHYPQPMLINTLVDSFLTAGANPTLPISKALLDHQSSALDFAQGRFAQVYEERSEDYFAMSYWYSVYRKLLAASCHEDFSAISALELADTSVLKGVSFIPEVEGENIEAHLDSDQDTVGTFKGWIHLSFDGFDGYVSPWTGALVGAKPLGFVQNKEVNLDELFKDYIGQKAASYLRGSFDDGTRHLDIQFEGGKRIRFIENIFNPFVQGENGHFLLFEPGQTEDDEEFDFGDSNRLIELCKDFDETNFPEAFSKAIEAGADVNERNQAPKARKDDSVLLAVIEHYRQCIEEGAMKVDDALLQLDGLFYSFFYFGFDLEREEGRCGARCLERLAELPIAAGLIPIVRAMLNNRLNPEVSATNEEDGTPIAIFERKRIAALEASELWDVQILNVVLAALKAWPEHRDWETIQHYSDAIGRRLDTVLYATDYRSKHRKFFLSEDGERIFTGKFFFVLDGVVLKVDSECNVLVDPTDASEPGQRMCVDAEFSALLDANLKDIEIREAPEGGIQAVLVFDNSQEIVIRAREDLSQDDNEGCHDASFVIQDAGRTE